MFVTKYEDKGPGFEAVLCSKKEYKMLQRNEALIEFDDESIISFEDALDDLRSLYKMFGDDSLDKMNKEEQLEAIEYEEIARTYSSWCGGKEPDFYSEERMSDGRVIVIFGFYITDDESV